MDLIELELSIKTINILQRADVWLLEDIVEKMKSEPTTITLALAKINPVDFAEITKALGKRSKNDLDKT